MNRQLSNVSWDVSQRELQDQLARSLVRAPTQMLAAMQTPIAATQAHSQFPSLDQIDAVPPHAGTTSACATAVDATLLELPVLRNALDFHGFSDAELAAPKNDLLENNDGVAIDTLGVAIASSQVVTSDVHFLMRAMRVPFSMSSFGLDRSSDESFVRFAMVGPLRPHGQPRRRCELAL